ncbi:MAG: acyl-CoA dehydrogenase family protein [Alphaproteobacteria bacterium]|nr:acyl-CoA dehydrogenase family protein [Alphaproteobacteria bacterium]
MSHRSEINDFSTHEVRNQSPPLQDYNLFDTDRTLKDAVGREGADNAKDCLRALGQAAGSENYISEGFLANRHSPRLHPFSRTGARIDEVEFHPAYHRIMKLAMEHEVHSIAWRKDRPAGHVAHAALQYLLTQVEAGACCPMAMTYAAVPVLRQQQDIAVQWEPRILSTQYDPRSIPVAEKSAATVGMAMTEKQGGSDVRAATTRAYPAGALGGGETYLLVGHKWFCSAPMSDAFLTLAYTEKGLSCFLAPRWRPDGTRNRIFLQRLKDKLGNRSNASAEIEYEHAFAWMIGEDGQGIQTIMEMVQHTRLDCAVAPAGMMRQAVVQAVHHARHRRAFQKRLIDQPLMQNVLADMILDSEAATLLAMRVAGAVDEGEDDDEARAFSRIAVAVAKYWNNKLLPNLTYEAMECFGGNGYVEESMMPRLYREAPVNSIWEGSGNVICLDILRAVRKEPASLEAFIEQVDRARGSDKILDGAVDRLKDNLRGLSGAEREARILTEQIATALQGSLMVQHAPDPLAEAFCRSRLSETSLRTYGTLPGDLGYQALIDRADIT